MTTTRSSELEDWLKDINVPNDIQAIILANHAIGTLGELRLNWSDVANDAGIPDNWMEKIKEKIMEDEQAFRVHQLQKMLDSERKTLKALESFERLLELEISAHERRANAQLSQPTKQSAPPSNKGHP